MAVFERNHWEDWAREWGFTHIPQRGKLYRDEGVVGVRSGFLVRAGWGGDKGTALMVLVRLPKGQVLSRLRDTLIADAALDALPGRGAAREKMAVEESGKRGMRMGGLREFVLRDGALLWTRVFSWRRPDSTGIRVWVDALVAAVSRASAGFDGRCEDCHTASVNGFVLVDELPMFLCSSCQQRRATEGDMASRAYDMQEASHARGSLFGAGAALVGAGLWAALAVGTQHIWGAAAVGIGALVAWAYRMGAGKVDGAGRWIAALLTTGSMVLGDMLFYSWLVALKRPDIGFSLEAGWYVYARAWQEAPGEQAISLVFALVGAWVAIRALTRPHLKPVIRHPAEIERPGRRAA
jgi:hypothetical protein